jgi:drug/metabolite transporter (DMT)-like permease
MPVFGMLSGIVFLGDKIVPTQIIGIGVVLSGIYLIDREKLMKR